MITIDLPRAKELVAEAVAERGKDYVYSNPANPHGSACEYMHGDQPGCLVGLVLIKAGVDPEYLMNATGTIGYLAHHMRNDGVASLSDLAQEFLSAAQFDQDSKRPWGEAQAVALDQLLDPAFQ